MPYRSYNVAAKIRRARWLALIAAAEVVLGALRDRHAGGYTSGDFVTGNVLNSLKRTDPEEGPTGMLIRIYSDQTDPPYPVYWTLGHVNLFTRRYERVDHWTPAIGDSALDARATYAYVFAREMAA